MMAVVVRHHDASLRELFMSPAESYLSTLDCFHPSLKTHQLLGIGAYPAASAGCGFTLRSESLARLRVPRRDCP